MTLAHVYEMAQEVVFPLGKADTMAPDGVIHKTVNELGKHNLGWLRYPGQQLWVSEPRL